MESFLSIEKVRCTLPQFELNINNLQLKRKDYFVIVGKTGSGKTVLLECLAGLKKLDGGQIFIDGSEISSTSPEDRQIGFAYQDSLLFPFLNVKENILFSAKAHRLDKNYQVLKRLEHIVERMGITHLLTRYPQHLSGGERQRVSLTRAILLQPKLLLLDEPLSALDANTRKEISQLLLDLHHNEEMTIIHVTHDISEALQLGTKMAVLQQGKIIEMNEPFSLYMQPTKLTTAVFLGVDNVFQATVKRENEVYNITHADGTFSITEKEKYIEQTEVTIGVRNMMIRITPPTEEHHSFRVRITNISFNGQMVLVECKNNNTWKAAISLTEWNSENYQMDDIITIYIAIKDILIFPN